MVNKKEVVANLLELAEKSIIESELKEKFIWSQHVKENERGNSKESEKYKMQFAAQKMTRQETFEPWKELLEKEL